VTTRSGILRAIHQADSGLYREYPNPGEFVQQAVAPLPGATKSPQLVAKIGPSEKVPSPVALLQESLFWTVPWAHHVILMEKIKDMSTRRWYMEQTLANGWSRSPTVRALTPYA
jgi:hypothetical protein